MIHKPITEGDIFRILQPETDLEKLLIAHPIVQEGLLWGEPRYGHPEGKVLYHVPEIYTNINLISPPLSWEDRNRLRLIALVHDVMKFKEDKSEPRDWSKHHGILGRHICEHLIQDKIVLDIIELHDEAYYCWRLFVLEEEPEYAAIRFNALLQRIGYCLQLFYVFFKCDTATGDKTQAPVKWFEKNIQGIQKIHFI
jgi:hypothetical protein